MNKICHLSSVHPRFDTRIFYKECSSLAKAGYDVSLIVADGGKYEIRNGVKIYGLKKQKSKLIRMLITPTILFKKAISLNADIYHLHDPELIPIGIKLKKLGKKVVFDSHEDVVKQIKTKPYLNNIVGKFFSKLYEIFEKKSIFKFDMIITISPSVFEKFNKLHSKVYMVKNYPIIGELQRTNCLVKRNNSILYLGGITKSRGIIELLQAIEMCESVVRLKLAGPFFPKSFRDELIRFEGWKKVDELGVVDRQKIAEVFTEVSIGLVTLLPTPNHLIALPVKLFEYMSGGLPVIISDFPLWRSYIEDCQCGICVNPLDPTDIAKAIDYLISNPKKASEMGQNGKKAIEFKFNWKNEEKKLLEAYKSLFLHNC